MTSKKYLSETSLSKSPTQKLNIKIKESAITTDKLADNAVTQAKIGSGAVTEAKIADHAVTTNKLGNDVTDTLTEHFQEVNKSIVNLEAADKTLQSNIDEVKDAAEILNADIVSLVGKMEEIGIKTIPTITIAELDTYWGKTVTEVANNLKNKLKPLQVNVVDKDNHTVGIVQVFSDNMWHQLTQVLVSHYASGSTLSAHYDGTVTYLSRSYGLAKASEGTESTGVWNSWSYIKDRELKEQIEGLREGFLALKDDVSALSDIVNATDTETIKLQVYPKQLSSKAIDASTGEVIDVDAKTEAYAQQNYVSDFITLKKSQTFYGENTLCRGSECLFAVYSISDSSFISSINRDNDSTPKSFSYTATEDVYVRISNCTNGSLGANAKFYIEYDITSDSTSLYNKQTVAMTETNYALGINTTTLLYSKRYQDFVSLVNIKDIDFIKITAKGEKAACIALLKSYSASSSQGDTPDFVNKVLYVIEKGTTIAMDVTDVTYILFVGSIDQLPNTLPAEIEYVRTNEAKLLSSTEQALLYEPDYTNIKVETESYVASEKFDIEGAERVAFKLYAVHTRPCYILDKNENTIKIFAYEDNTEGEIEGEIEVPHGAKYLVYRTKYAYSNYYIHVYYSKQMNAQHVKEEIDSIREITKNSGFHYLANGYDIVTTNDDNSVALQDLIDTVNKNGGGIIELGLGTYNFKNTVTMKSNVGIMGQGIGHTILNMVDNDTATDTWPLFDGDFVKNIFIKDLEIHSEETTTTGKHLFMRYIEDSHFTRIKSVGSRPTAIGIDFLNHVTITDNIIINGGRMENIFGCACIGIGTGYDEWENEDFVISNNICINGGQRGIFVEDQARFGGKAKMKAGYGQVITGNVVRGGYRGITVEAGKRVNVSGNTIYGASIGMGVKVYADDCLFQGNLLVGNKTGVIVDDLSSTFVENNNLAFIGNTIKGSDTGFSVKTDGMVTGLYIKDNVIQDNVNGIVIEGGCKNLVVQGNNDYSTAKSFSFGGTFTNAVIKDNTYFIDPVKDSDAAFEGTTKWVEQVEV